MKKKCFFLGIFLTLFLFFPSNLLTVEAGRQVPHYDIREAGGKWNGTNYYLKDGTLVKDAFFCDGTYTYYLQADGTPMKDRLTYHPDGEHVIYFDENGHEIFSDFTHVKMSIAGTPVDDLCFFDVYGYMYVDVLTYDKEGVNLYYANPYGVMECNGWFRYSNGRLGYANSDGKLTANTWSLDAQGRPIYFQGNGSVATDFIKDNDYFYKLHPYDGYVEAQVPIAEVQAGTESAKAALCNLYHEKNYTFNKYLKYEFAYKTGYTNDFNDADWAFFNGLKEYLDYAYQYATAYEREKAIHDYMVLHTVYDYDNYLNDTIPAESYHPEGVFVNKTSVCEGYAESFQICMNILGIPSILVTGSCNGEGHAWNAVQLDNEWYMVDVTWDDPVPDVKGKVRYDYLNLTDTLMKQDHTYTCPIVATGTKYNYYYLKYKNSYTDETTFFNAITDWASSSANGSVTQVNVCINGNSYVPIKDNYIKPLANINVTAEILEKKFIDSKWFISLELKKHPSTQDMLSLFTEWSKTANYGDTTTIDISLNSSGCENSLDIFNFCSLLEDNAILMLNYENMGSDTDYVFVNYSVTVVKSYSSLEDFHTAALNWKKNATSGQQWTIYLPYKTFHNDKYRNIYEIPLEENGMFRTNNEDIQENTVKLTYVNSFTYMDSPDMIINHAQDQLDKRDNYIFYYTIYIRTDDYDINELGIIDALKEWANNNNASYRYETTEIGNHIYTCVRISA